MKFGNKTVKIIIIIAILVLLMYLVSGEKSPHDVLYNKFIKTMNALKPYTSMIITTDKLDDTINADMFTQHVVVEGFAAIPVPKSTPLTDMAKIYERQTMLEIELTALEGNRILDNEGKIIGFIPGPGNNAQNLYDTYNCTDGDFTFNKWNDRANQCQRWARHLSRYYSRGSWASDKIGKIPSISTDDPDYQTNLDTLRGQISDMEPEKDSLYNIEVELNPDTADNLLNLRTEYIQLLKNKETSIIEGLTVIEDIKYPLEAGIVNSYKKAKEDVINEQRNYLKAIVDLLFAHTDRRMVEVGNYGSEGDRNRERNEKNNSLTNKTNGYNNALEKRNNKQVILETVESTMGHIVAPTPDVTNSVREKETEIFNLINNYLRLSSDYLVLSQGGIHSAVATQKRNDYERLVGTIKNTIDQHRSLRLDELTAQVNILNGTTSIDTTGYASMDLDALNKEAIKWANEVRLLENALMKASDQMTYGNDVLAINIHPLTDDNGNVIAQEDDVDISRNAIYADYEASVDTIQQKLNKARNSYFTTLVARDAEYVTLKAENENMKSNFTLRLEESSTVEDVEAIKIDIQAEKVGVNNIIISDYLDQLKASQVTLNDTIQAETDPVLKAGYQKTYDISGILISELKEMNNPNYAYENLHPDSISTLDILARQIYEIEKGSVNDDLRTLFEAHLIARERAEQTGNSGDINLSNDSLITYQDTKDNYITEINALYDEIELVNKINYIEIHKNDMLDGLLVRADTIIDLIQSGNWETAPTVIVDDEGRELDVDIIKYYDQLNDKIDALQKELSNLPPDADRSEINNTLITYYNKQVNYISTVRADIKAKITEYENAKVGRNSRERGIYNGLISYYEELLPLIDYLGVESTIGSWLIVTYGRPILIDLGMALFNTPAFDNLVLLPDSMGVIPEAKIENAKARLSKLITTFLYDTSANFFSEFEKMVIDNSSSISAV